MILTGDEPQRWHRNLEDGRVVHALGDPRKDGIPKRDWDADMRRYVDHLERCEAIFDPEQLAPVDWDLPVTGAMFAAITASERKIDKLRMVIVAIRQAQQQGKTDAEIEAMFASPDKTGDRHTVDRPNLWKLILADPDSSLSEADRGHVADQIRQGYTEGQIAAGTEPDAEEGDHT